LPPTLTVQYHFSPDAIFRPYVGAGVNYTIFWDENGAPGLPMEYEDAFGAALQAGFDYALDEHWFLNVDVKKIFLSTEVSVAGGAVTADVDIDPWIVGAGFGYRF
jgi:outer membrane protein